MVTRRRWALADPPSPEAREALIAFPPFLRQVLVNRGIETPGVADRFLRPDERQHGSPFDIPDMDMAVRRILFALRDGERIAVYGDFDADGVTATALLLEALRPLALHITPYIPDRAEGHGLNQAALTRLRAEGCSVVITADCGTTGLSDGGAVPPGMDIVVTDHHLSSETRPDFAAVVNPMRRDSKYPSPQLAGVGVAYKLAQAIYAKLDLDLPGHLTEFVALGTIGDVAPLTGENRYLVRRGLVRLRRTERPGLRALLGIANRQMDRLTAEDIAFQIVPRLNAPGRLSHANDSLRLLTTADEAEANALAAALNELNTQRRQLTEQAYGRARELLSDDDLAAPLIMAGAPGIAPGIVGLVAGRLSEEFHRPCLVYTQDGDGHVRGSARSIPEFDVAGALTQCAPLLISFGGHHRAAGFTAWEGDVALLKSQLLDIAGAALDGLDIQPVLRLDAEGAPSAIASDLEQMLDTLEPFGEGNARPVFMTRGIRVLSARTVGDGAHLRLTLGDPQADRTWDAIAFRQGGMADAARGDVDIAFHFQMNDGGPGAARRPALELNVLDFRPTEDHGAEVKPS